MNPYPLADFRMEIESSPMNDAQDIMVYLPRLSRWAALAKDGGTDFQRWSTLVERHAPNFDVLLRERIREGLWDLDEALGEYLGVAIAHAQDFACFDALARRWTPDAFCQWVSAETREGLAVWRDAANGAALDAEAAEWIVDWAALFPLPADLRLDVIDAPISKCELALITGPGMTTPLPVAYYAVDTASGTAAPTAAEALTPSPIVTTIASWSSARDTDIAMLPAAEGEAPPQSLTDRVAWDVQLLRPKQTTWTVTRRLDEDWRLRIWVEEADDTPVPLRAVRQGVWPARIDDSGGWTIPLRALSRDQRFAVLRAPLWLTTSSDTRLCLH